MEITNSLFMPPRNGEHPLYRALRDGPDAYAANRREFFARLWERFGPIAPKSFRKKLQFEFHQRWWEMYLAVGLMNLGFSPWCPPSDKGPDICVAVHQTQVFLEAVAPTPGGANTSDRVPDLQYGVVYNFPEEECLLRLTQALTDHCDKFRKYYDRGQIPADSPCIIALSSGRLNPLVTKLDGAPLSVLAGVGSTVVTIRGTGPPFASRLRRDSIRRDSGSEVDTRLFYRDDFRVVSGVLYSSSDPWNAPDRPEDTFRLYLNPNADTELPVSLSSVMETWGVESASEHETVWKRHLPSLRSDLSPHQPPTRR